MLVINSNIVEIVHDNINRESVETLLVVKNCDVYWSGLVCHCVVDNSIDDEAVIPDVLPHTGTNIAVRQVGVDLLVLIVVHPHNNWQSQISKIAPWD